MPAKNAPKSKAAKEEPMASNPAWKWVYVVGGLVAALAGAFAQFVPSPINTYLGYLLMIVGVLVGLFYFDSADVVNFGLRYLILLAAAKALDSFIAVGPYISGFFTGFAGFLGPVVRAMLVVYFWKKYFGSMM